MKKVLTLGVLALFAGACVLSIYADDKKEKEQPNYHTVGNKKTGTTLMYGHLADMNGVWVFDEKAHAQTALVADGGGTRLVFASDDTKHDCVKLGLGVSNNKPYIWFRDAKGNVKSIDLEKLPLLDLDKDKEKPIVTGGIKKD